MGGATAVRDPNCYTRLPYRGSICDGDCYGGHTVASQLEELDLPFDSASRNNDHWLLFSLIAMKLSIIPATTEKMFCIVGPRGGGKGLDATIEQRVMGAESSARHGPSIFGSEAEFRRPSHYAIGKKDILSSESRGGGQFVGDIWKRFSPGEPCDVRANFGETDNPRFRARKAKSWNYGDIPVLDQHRASWEG